MGVEAEQLIDQLRATLENIEVALSTIDEAVVWVGRHHQAQWRNRAFEKLVDCAYPGIPAAILQSLFKLFVQASSHIPGGGGAGLGLAIIHQFVRMMGGQVTVESEVGQGSTFSFFLPVTLTKLSGQPPSPLGRTVRRLAANQTAYRLLVVDDHCENREPLERQLASIGFEVEAVSNGLEAIERYQHWRPRLIWMDLPMPMMDGYEATRRIREMEAAQIIAPTASAFEDQRQKALAVGCDDKLVAQVPQSHAERQASLMHLVERFDFDALVELTENQTHAKSH